MTIKSFSPNKNKRGWKMGRPKRLARDIGHPSQVRYEQIRRRLAASVDSVCEGAGGSDGHGNTLKITQVQLAAQAGIRHAQHCATTSVVGAR